MGSDFLFTTPGFLAGAARVIDLFGELEDYNFAPNSEMADAIAMRGDWQAVGGDLRAAMDEYRAQAHSDQLPLFEDGQHATASP